MATSIFQLVGSILVDSDAADKSLQKTDKNASSVGKTLLNGAKSAGKFAAGLTAAAGTAVAGLVSVATSAASTMDTIDKASQRMDISAESYQELSHAAGLCGVEMSTLEKAAKKLEGTDLNMDQALEEIYSLTTAEERSAKAAELFGDSVAYQLSPMLNATGEEMAAMRQEANDLGLVMSEDSVKAGAALNDSISKIKDSFGALGANLGAELLPIVQEGCDMILEFMPTLQSIIQKVGPTLTQLLKTLLPVFVQLVEKVLPPLVKLIDALLPLFTTLCELILPIIVELLTLIVNFIVDKVIPAITKVVNVIQSALSNAGTFFQNFKTKVVSIFEGIRDGIKKPINAVISFINGLIKGVTSGVNAIVKAMNKLHFDVPDWVPGLGGKSFGFDLKEVTAPEIPLLAEGAVIEPNKPFAAILGDQKNGQNIEAPLETIKQAVSEVISEIAVNVNFAVEGDPAKLFKVVQKEAKTYTKRTGSLAF